MADAILNYVRRHQLVRPLAGPVRYNCEPPDIAKGRALASLCSHSDDSWLRARYIHWTWLARANAWILCVSWRQTSIYQQSLLMCGVYSPEDSVACDVCSDATSAAKDSSICGMILHGGMHAVYASSLGWPGHGSGRQHARPYPERACPNCRNSRIRR